ncbi:putative N(2),N(2)-dimethylguanosine tRNA methyltransferase [Papilio xuthus]|uniref:tRNA (guanine(26)-N(2))-dimethyltransferase n=1 Tax=Papilio xuthus TaxID=66420 RepID=A0A194QHS0_PAPXU|nr:putative N(2),N(2)-dimethylguanosine tRNA methyltransferase [Papilio xuthus]
MKMEESTLEKKTLKSIKEGQAEICLKTDKVFYNPVQEFNRDLSIAVLSVFTEEFIAEKLALKQKKTQNVNSNINNDNNQIPVTILEALSATGLRSIRYAKEVPNVSKIIANDLSQEAVNTIKENIIHNNVQNIIDTSHDDACMLMYKHKHPIERFTVIDLDPYGCPSIFLDSAVQSVQDGGLLLVTATDMAVLAGNSPETCYSKYGAISLKTKCCHEMLGGPIWSAPIHDEVFVSKVLTHVQEHPDLFGTAKRLDGVLSMVREELMDAPLYYILDKMFGRVHCETMPMLVMRSAILNAGYKVSYSHAAKLSVKTAAPAHVIWDIVRTWEKTHPVKPAKLEADPVARHILSRETETAIDLSERADANPISRRDGRLRFQFNPTPYWGPGSRAAINVGDEKMSKAIRNQNKHKNKERRQGKREHSPRSDEEARKIQAKTDENVEIKN